MPLTRMSVERFFELLLEEAREHPALESYYSFLARPSRLQYRKTYFTQRLRYIADQLRGLEGPVLDCGCGFGTTALFLAMNGVRVHGTNIGTIYSDELPRRFDYWKRHGDPALFTHAYEDVVEHPPAPGSYQAVVVQDTLHHMEPIEQALSALCKAVAPGGPVVVVEENGESLVRRLRLYMRRGNRRVIEIYDEVLDRRVLLGNENIRSFEAWRALFAREGFELEQPGYCTITLPWLYRGASVDRMLDVEQMLGRRSALVRRYGFLGMQFVARAA